MKNVQIRILKSEYFKHTIDTFEMFACQIYS